MKGEEKRGGGTYGYFKDSSVKGKEKGRGGTHMGFFKIRDGKRIQNRAPAPLRGCSCGKGVSLNMLRMGTRKRKLVLKCFICESMISV